MITPYDLKQFTGDLERYRHTINPQVIYTPGIQYLAQQAEAYWLIDEIAILLGTPSFKNKLSADPRAQELLFWQLAVQTDESAHLIAFVDSGEPPIFRKRFSWTDFPMSKVDIWSGFDGRHWTLYLPSEH